MMDSCVQYLRPITRALCSRMRDRSLPTIFNESRWDGLLSGWHMYQRWLQAYLCRIAPTPPQPTGGVAPAPSGRSARRVALRGAAGNADAGRDCATSVRTASHCRWPVSAT